MKLRTYSHYKPFEVRSVNGANTVEGYAALFNSPSEPLWQLGGRRELIMPGAFGNALQRGDDVRLLVNHDDNLLLARTTSGTLKLTQDEVGLYFQASLPNTTYANDLVEVMRRGDMSQCSFAFEPDQMQFENVNGETFNVVRDLHLMDVSVVTVPAYTATIAQARAQFRQFFKSLEETPLINIESASNSAAMDCVARRKREIEWLELD